MLSGFRRILYHRCDEIERLLIFFHQVGKVLSYGAWDDC